MKTIVAPVNFSEASLNAVNYAADMACVIGTSLSLIHVCPIPMVYSEVPVPVYTIKDLVAGAQRSLEEIKEKILFETKDRIKIYTEVRQGNVVSEIESYSNSVDTYAVVMGPEGANAFERFLMEGNTINAVKQLSCPLIIVPSGIKFTAIKKICLACDLKDITTTIPVMEIRHLMKAFNPEFHVLHINVENEENEKEWLKEVLEEYHPKYHFINSEDIEKSIIDFTEKHHIDLLIIVPKKHSFFASIIKHNHAKRIVLHTHFPVMSIHE